MGRVLLIVLLMPLAAFAQDEGLRAGLVRTAAEQVLAEQYPDDAYRLDVRVKRVEGTLDEAAALRLVFPASHELPGGTTQVRLLTGSDAAGWQKAGWALLYVARYDSVVVVSTTVAAGDEVTPDVAGTAWVETTKFPGEPLRPSDVRAFTGGVFARHTLREGKVLRQSDVRPAYAAETGAAITMRYQRSGITFDLACTARESGYVGEAIRLHSDATGKIYRARLTGTGTAVWLETL